MPKLPHINRKHARYVFVGRRSVFTGYWALLLVLWAATAAFTASQINLKLAVGSTATIDDVDPGATVSVRVYSGGRPFYVQSPSPRQLAILAASRGEGEVSLQRQGVPVTYHITVTSISDPAKPLAPGINPPPLGSPHFSGSADDDRWAPPKSDASAVTPATYAVPPTSSGTNDGRAGVDASSTAMIPEAPVIPNQAEMAPPPVSHQNYATDPSAHLGSPRLTIPGRNPLPDGPLTLMAGTGGVYDFPEVIARVSTTDSKVADVQVVNPHQLIIVGKEPGFASLFVWDDQNNYFERQIRIEKGGEQQVLLNVIVAEVNRTKMENQGIDFTSALTQYGLSFASLPGFVANAYNATQVFNTSNGTYTGFLPPGGNYYPLSVSNNITYALSGNNQALNTNSFFQFLEEHGLGKVLAQPNLLATSGEEAKFLSGGEIPIIISQALNTSIVFKQYGTSVSFVPTVVGRDQIELLVRPEVSAPDYTHQVILNGFSVPSFVTRKAETLVRLRDQQTLVIAGLMQDVIESDIKKVPYLGDVPYAGALFRNTSWSHVKTELVMSVTPRLVRPIPAGASVTLPTSTAGVLTPAEVQTQALPVDDVTRPRFR